jgi:ubiquinone/menaquinone biosynthesis C-methylase UbiE
MNKNLFKNNIIELKDGLFEVQGLANGEYDKQAVKYDNIVSNGLYNRLMWGNSPKDYSNFCNTALKENVNGIIADIGCGTLSFTSEVYAKNQIIEIYLCDLSEGMLKIGKEKLEKIRNDLSKIFFLRSNALDMPFYDNTIQTIFCFGFLHIINNPALLIREFKRMLISKGKLYLTSLCTDRKFSAKYLSFLHKKEIVAKPMNSSEIIKIIEGNGFKIEKSNVKGGMVYLTAISES